MGILFWILGRWQPTATRGKPWQFRYAVPGFRKNAVSLYEFVPGLMQVIPSMIVASYSTNLASWTFILYLYFIIFLLDYLLIRPIFPRRVTLYIQLFWTHPNSPVLVLTHYSRSKEIFTHACRYLLIVHQSNGHFYRSTGAIEQWIRFYPSPVMVLVCVTGFPAIYIYIYVFTYIYTYK